MIKKLILPIILLAGGVWLAHHRLTQVVEFNTFHTITVVLVCMLPGSGGTERYTLAQQQEFIKLGVPTITICHTNPGGGQEF